MNTIFVDFYNNNKERKKNNFDNKKICINELYKLNDAKINCIKYQITDDILNGKKSKITHVSIKKEYIINQTQKLKYSMQDKIFKMNINKKFGKNDEVNLVFSKEFEYNIKLKEYIIDLLKLNKLTMYNEIKIKNELKNKDMMYIDKYIKDKNITIEKLKILVVIDNFEDYDKKKFLEYISKYKYVDILVTNNISQFDFKKLEKDIILLNNEYGTTTEIIKKRNVQKYDVYLVYSNIPRFELSQRYILGRNSLYINLTDIDYDILSDEVLTYERFEPEITTLFNRLNLNLENFSKSKVGFLYK